MLCRRYLPAAVLAALLFTLPALADSGKPSATPQQLLAASSPAEWRRPDPHNLLVMQLPSGRVLIELAPDFTPLHAANIRTLATAHYFDGLAIVRVQDNFVTQWDDPAGDDGGSASKVRSLGKASATVAPEFTRPIDRSRPFTKLPDGDVYAAEVGFSNGFPMARDSASGQEWLAHCYGMVGVGRDNGPETGNGSALYAVIGQAPRRLDRNLAVVGRVLDGMPLLSSLPRGTGPMGFYDRPGQQVTIRSIQLAFDMPAAQRPAVEVLRTDSATFAALIDARRNRRDAFYTVPTGKLDLCSMDVPTRYVTAKAPAKP